MDVSELRTRAAATRGRHANNAKAQALLAGLADWEAALLKRAVLRVASEWANRDASALLLDAVQECGETRVGADPKADPRLVRASFNQSQSSTCAGGPPLRYNASCPLA
jgi:hypothetical protein